MSARECPGCAGTGKCHTLILREACECGEKCADCDGSGKVWPSVEGEIVVKDSADQYGQIHISGLETGTTYRVIVQKVGEKP